MRRAFYTALLFTAAISATASAATPCKPKLDHRKLDQTAIGNLQVQKVNSWKEEWRMDPKKTAQHEVVASSLTQMEHRTWESVPVTFIKGDDRTQVYSFRENERSYEITMKKPEWLLPYSGIYKIMMWVVTDVKTTCPK
jgi:hypothetical protein